MVQIPRELRDVSAVAPLALGAAPIGNLFARLSDDQAEATLEAAWASDIRLVDTAPYYGHGLSEVRIGRHRSRNPAQTFTLSTKVGRRLEACAAENTPEHGFASPLPNRPVFDYSRDGVLRAFESSLARLGVERVACLLLHDIGPFVHGRNAPAVLTQALNEALPAMTDLKRQGLTDAIGLGVNETSVCEQVLAHADLDVVLLAGRYTLLDQSGRSLLDRAHADGVGVLAAGVFNSGFLAGGSTYDYAPASPELITRRDRLAMLCTRHGVELPAAAIQFAASHPAIRQVVVGLRSPAEVAQASAWHATTIPTDFWRELAAWELIELDESATW